MTTTPRTYTLSIHDIHFVNAMRYFRHHSDSTVYATLLPRISEIMTIDAYIVYIKLVNGGN